MRLSRLSLKTMTEHKILKIIGVIVFFIFILSISLRSVSSPMSEPFVNSGEYPLADDKQILYNDYTVADDGGGISALNSSDIYTEYPVFPVGSVKTNNIRYWTQPDNGKCTPPEMCGGLYVPTKQNIPPPAKAPSWSAAEPRVNFYSSV